MESDGISPSYSVICKNKKFVISGTEETSGEKTETVLLTEEETARKFAEILNKNGVSVHHAKDFIQDFLAAQMEE